MFCITCVSSARAGIGTRSAAKIYYTASLIIGDILILINCIAWSIYMVMVKPMMMKYKTVTVVKWVFLFGSIYVLPFGWSGITSFNIVLGQ